MRSTDFSLTHLLLVLLADQVASSVQCEGFECPIQTKKMLQTQSHVVKLTACSLPDALPNSSSLSQNGAYGCDYWQSRGMEECVRKELMTNCCFCQGYTPTTLLNQRRTKKGRNKTKRKPGKGGKHGKRRKKVLEVSELDVESSRRRRHSSHSSPSSHSSHSSGSGATFRGYWRKVWDKTEAIPSDTTDSVAFNGYADPSKAKEEADKVKSQLKGVKWISQGGGDKDGRTTEAGLNAWISKIKAGFFKDYSGIAFDTEEGDTGLCTHLNKAISAAKQAGFKTMVTIPHQQPFGIKDAPTLMRCIFSNTELDYLSPQVYSHGKEKDANFELTASWTKDHLQWSAFGACKAKLIPSISFASQYEGVKSFFASAKGGKKKTDGYVLWGSATKR